MQKISVDQVEEKILNLLDTISPESNKSGVSSPNSKSTKLQNNNKLNNNNNKAHNSLPIVRRIGG